MGIFESTRVIGRRCCFPPPSIPRVSFLIQTAFLPRSPLKLKDLNSLQGKSSFHSQNPVCFCLSTHFQMKKHPSPESAHQPTEPTQKLTKTSLGEGKKKRNGYVSVINVYVRSAQRA